MNIYTNVKTKQSIHCHPQNFIFNPTASLKHVSDNGMDGSSLKFNKFILYLDLLALVINIIDLIFKRGKILNQFKHSVITIVHK